MPALDDALQILTTDQPAQPSDRLAGVTRKARRIRATRAAVSVAAVVALAVPVSLAVTSTRAPHTGDQFATTKVDTWHDRSVAKDRARGEGALQAWGGYGGPAAHWLYRGEVRLKDGSTEFLAIFTAEQDNGTKHLVVAHAPTADLNELGFALNPVPNETSYSIDDKQTFPGVVPTQVSLVLDDSTFFVLGPEQARTLRWSQDPLPYAPTVTGLKRSAVVRSGNGVFTGSFGLLTGPVSVQVFDQYGRNNPPAALTYTNGLALVRPADPDLPVGFNVVRAASGTSAQNEDGTWGGNRDGGVQASPIGVSVYVRCYGGGPLKAALLNGQADSTPVYARGTVTCDGTSQEAFHYDRSVPTYGIDIQPTRLQAYSYSVVGTV